MTSLTTDVATSARMSRQRRQDTKIELFVGATLRELGLRYRKNVRALPGSPDFANRKRRWAVFVNGCYWHHHTGCAKATVPKTNGAFWTDKFRANRRRDALAIGKLRAAGFKVVVIWECDRTRIRGRLAEVLEARRVDC